jgi:hypothetical protein
MWVDGVLDDERLSKLAAEPGISVVQHPAYVLAYFNKRPRRQHYRYLDPHRFIVQMDATCTELEINFNPSPGEIEKLRAFLRGQQSILQSQRRLT